MLFTSSIRRGLEYGGSGSSGHSASDTHHSRHAHHQQQQQPHNSSATSAWPLRRRSLLVRRHTCSTLDPLLRMTASASAGFATQALLAPLGGQLLGQVHFLDPTTDRLIAIKSLVTTPRGSVCVPMQQHSISSDTSCSSRHSLTSLAALTSMLPRSLSSSVLRSRRRSSQQQQRLLAVGGMAKHVATATLTPALLNATNTGGPPAMAPPPLPALITNTGATTAKPTGVDPFATATAPPYAFPPAFDGTQTAAAPATTSAPIYPTLQHQQSKPVTAPPAPLPGFDAWDDPTGTAGVVAPSYVTKNNQNSGGGAVNKTMTASGTATAQAGASPNTFDDDFDDDWSDDDEEVAEFTAAHSFAGAGGTSKMVARSRSTGPETISMSAVSKQQQQQGGTTRMRNLNRFSNFVKTGMEGYILASAKFNAPSGERHEIVLVSNGAGAPVAEWQRPQQIYTCMITKPKKESKLKGLKSFIAYSLTSSLSGIQVSRRYKHFDWLHFQLTNKYLLIPIPPLPEKQVAGRYEEDLIEHRRAILQLWVNKICRHPVLGQSEVWRHFMTCTDEAKWKRGKRQAERDEYVGGNFFNCITAPSTPMDLANVERQVEQFARTSRSLEESCRNMYERVTETQKRLTGPYKANWQKMATAFDTLGQSLDLDLSQANNPVKNAIKTSAHYLHKIGNQHEEHGRKDLEQLLDFLFVSKGIYAGIPDIVNVHKSVLAKMRENERLQNEGKITTADADAIRQRVDVCSYAMLAEMEHQQEERDLDMATMFGAYFSQQAAFYHNIGNQLTQLAALFKPGAK